MKTLFLTAGIGLLTVAGVIIFPWIALYLSIMLSPNPPSPKVTYGEFPFKLEYEINGEHKVVEDTLICEFAGFGANEASGKYREWKSHLKSGNKKIILLQLNDTDYIYYNPGNERYYMGEWNKEEYKYDFPNARVFLQKTKIKTQRGLVLSGIDGLLEPDDLQKYNIKLISWNPSAPIVNEFK